MPEIHNILKKATDDFNKIETESAPSGEWDSYNIHYLVEEARVEGMETIVDKVGKCGNCAQWDKDTETCNIFTCDGTKWKENDYCSKFILKQTKGNI